MMNAWGTPLKKSSPTSIGGQCSRFTSDSVNKTTNKSSDRFRTNLRDGNNHKSTSSDDFLHNSNLNRPEKPTSVKNLFLHFLDPDRYKEQRRLRSNETPDSITEVVAAVTCPKKIFEQIKGKQQSSKKKFDIFPPETGVSSVKGHAESYIRNKPERSSAYKPPLPSKPISLQKNIPTMQRTPVNVISSCSFRENFIENEIREAAEREERWKQEKSESPLNSETISPTPELDSPTRSLTPIQEQEILPDSKFDSLLFQNGESYSVPDSVSTSSEPIVQTDNNCSQESKDTPVINTDEPPPQNYVTEKNDVTCSTGDKLVGNSKADKKFLIPLNLETNQPHVPLAMGQSPLSPNSTLLLSPKGWDATSPKVKPVSPIIPRAMTSSVQTHSLQTDSVQTDSVQTDSVQTDSVQTDSVQTDSVQSDFVQTDSVQIDSVQTKFAPSPATRSNSGRTESEAQEKKLKISVDEKKPVPAEKPSHLKTPPGVPQKSSPSFEILSSKSRPETMIAMEIKEAEEREKEWRIHEKKVLSSDPHGDPPPVLPREETSREDLSNPINVEEKKDVEPEVAKDEIPMGPSESAPVVKMRSNTSAEYRKKAVVKANRVPRRRSMLGERWESGEFFNHQE